MDADMHRAQRRQHYRPTSLTMHALNESSENAMFEAPPSVIRTPMTVLVDGRVSAVSSSFFTHGATQSHSFTSLCENDSYNTLPCGGQSQTQVSSQDTVRATCGLFGAPREPLREMGGFGVQRQQSIVPEMGMDSAHGYDSDGEGFMARPPGIGLDGFPTPQRVREHGTCDTSYSVSSTPARASQSCNVGYPVFAAPVEVDYEHNNFTAHLTHTVTSAKPFRVEIHGFSEQGQRSYQEDEYAVEALGVAETLTHYGGVFDGHGGAHVSQYAAKAVHQHLTYNASFDHDLPTAMAAALRHTDFSVHATMASCAERMGSTALVACVRGRVLHLANLGDCRAVMCVNGTAMPVTADHHPDVAKERERIYNAGNTTDFGYIEGYINVSRALGDFCFKKGDQLSGAISNVPEITTIPVSDAVNFVLMASDGLWDVMPEQDAVDFVYSRMNPATPAASDPMLTQATEVDDEEFETPSRTPRDMYQSILKELVQYAIREKRASDNVTCLAVVFP